MSNDEWKQDLSDLFDSVNSKVEAKNRLYDQQLSASITFLLIVVKSAFEQVKSELGKYGREASITISDQFASIVVEHEGKVELDYSFRLHGNALLVYPLAKKATFYTVQNYINDTDPLSDIPPEDVIKSVIKQYRINLGEA